MKITNVQQNFYCYFENTNLPAIEGERIGFRLMLMCLSRYANIKKFELNN